MNFGAGTIVSSLRHDGGNHMSMANLSIPDAASLRCVAGHGVRTGIHISIYFGRKLWPYTSTRPGAIIQRQILS